MTHGQAVRRMLCASALAVAIGSCASMVVARQEVEQASVAAFSPLPGGIPSSLYQAEIGDFQLTGLQRNQRSDGYTVESGTLVEAKGAASEIVGSLVAVRSPLNAVTAIIDRPGKRGLLLVDSEGKRRFIEEPAYDYLRADTLPGEQENASVPAEASSAGHDIDALIAFSTKALDVLDSDPVAFALAQLETANLGLRNSGVEGVRMNLAGIVVTDTDHGVDSAGLSATQAFMNPLRSTYLHDVNVGYYDESPYGGMAYVPGYSSVNGIHYPMAFRHEIGHNVGGSHCYPDAGNNYRHGHQTADGAHTHLCGNNVPYYSSPLVTLDDHPLGNAATADMARLWREQADRLSSYSPPFEGQRFTAISGVLNVFAVTPASGHTEVGFVALSAEVGPTELDEGTPGNHTPLSVPLTGTDGVTRTVKLRASKTMLGICPYREMNESSSCGRFGVPILSLSLRQEDNPSLPRGWYNGAVRLKAVSRPVEGKPDWSLPILVSVAVEQK